jgi:hypothetical protein
MARLPTEIRADQHLRRWRKSVEQAQSYFKAAYHYRSGFVGAVARRQLLANDPRHRAGGTFCFIVERAIAWRWRRVVPLEIEAAVESWARAKGISDMEIERARRCLK